MSKIASYIRCSDVMSFVNQNKWDYVKPFLTLWEKNDTVIFNKIKNNSTTLVDPILQMKQVCGEDFIPKKEITSLIELRKISESSIKKIDNMIIPDSLKSELKDTVKNTCQTAHGTNNELSALDIYANKKAVQLDTSQTYTKKKLFETDTKTWFIGGCVDAKTEHNIIEVKTRTYCFFKYVKDYENTQIQMYMFIHGYNTAELVEFYNKRIKITEIKRDEDYIQKTISKLRIFIEKFEEFLSKSEDEKKHFYELDIASKKTFLQDLYLNQMNF